MKLWTLPSLRFAGSRRPCTGESELLELVGGSGYRIGAVPGCGFQMTQTRIGSTIVIVFGTLTVLSGLGKAGVAGLNPAARLRAWGSVSSFWGFWRRWRPRRSRNASCTYVTHSAGFRHDSIETSIEVLRSLSPDQLAVTATEDLSTITAGNLLSFDAVFFFTSGELAISGDQKTALGAAGVNRTDRDFALA